MIQAGRKYNLADIDLRLNEIMPEARGRLATLAVHDVRLGTESPFVLIESQEFYRRDDQRLIAARVAEEIGFDQVEVAFVPPLFLTKTSSGKINRNQTKADWLLVNAGTKRKTDLDPVAEIREAFAHVGWNVPVREALDSLSQTLLRIILSDTRIGFDAKRTLREIVGLLETAEGGPDAVQGLGGVEPAADPASRTPNRLASLVRRAFGPMPAGDASRPPPASTANPETGTSPTVIRIVSLADRLVFRGLTDAHLDRLEEILGAPVTFEHVCLPPSAIILSDLIFQDYFQPRLDQAPFTAVNHVLQKLREASVLIFDDRSEMFFPPQQVYGALSHNLTRDPGADLLTFRWATYPKYHDALPVTVVTGADLPLDHCTSTTEGIGRYLQKPLFRITQYSGFAEFTRGWEYEYRTDVPARELNLDHLIGSLGARLGRAKQPLERRASTPPRPPGPPAGRNAVRIDLSEPPHFCAAAVRREAVDLILRRFDSFLVVGQSSSVPYVRKEIERMGKTFMRAPSYSPQIMKSLPRQFDCMLICGAMGKYPIKMPAAALQPIDVPERTFQLEEFGRRLLFLNEKPETRRDWFYEHATERHKSRLAWNNVQATIQHRRAKSPNDE